MTADSEPSPRGRRSPQACSACGSEAELEYYQILKPGDSRAMHLCSNCRSPLELLLRAVPKRVISRTPIIVTPVSKLKPSPTLRAQKVRGKK